MDALSTLIFKKSLWWQPMKNRTPQQEHAQAANIVDFMQAL